MHKKSPNKGIISIAFATGLLLSCFCPYQVLIAILAITVIVLGVSCIRCR